MGYEFFEEKIIFPSTPVPGINNDQSLILKETSASVKLTSFFWSFFILSKVHSLAFGKVLLQ